MVLWCFLNISPQKVHPIYINKHLGENEFNYKPFKILKLKTQVTKTAMIKLYYNPQHKQPEHMGVYNVIVSVNKCVDHMITNDITTNIVNWIWKNLICCI